MCLHEALITGIKLVNVVTIEILGTISEQAQLK